MHMMNKRARRNRIGLMFAGTVAGMMALWAPNAQATGDHTGDDRRIVRVITTPQPGKAMRAALTACAPVPAQSRQMCHSLALRPAIGDIPAGLPVVRECRTEARAEGKRYGAAAERRYLANCFRGNIVTP